MASTAQNHLATPVSWISKLPAELRNQIYDYLVSAGDLALARTNREICKELLAVVDTKCHYLLFINYPRQPEYPSAMPIRTIDPQVRNFHVHWDTHIYELPEDVRSIAALRWDPGIPRGNCCVFFERCAFQPTVLRSSDFYALQTFARFEQVIFRVVPKEFARLSRSIKRDTPAFSVPGTMDSEALLARLGYSSKTSYPPQYAEALLDRLGYSNKPCYPPQRCFELLRSQLEPYLGKAEEREDDNGVFLEFRPPRSSGRLSYSPPVQYRCYTF